jgi:hypothetical protein
MKPIFDYRGATVGWLDSERVLDIQGNDLAFVRGGCVYSYLGDYLGTFDRGYFRDRHGDAVAFIKEASSGPLRPLTEIPPVPPVPPIRPVPPIPELPPIPPLPTLAWSQSSWDEFLAGE